RRLQPDVVVLDLAMPKLDGWEVCRRLKADAATRGIAIIIVTAHIAPGIRESAERAGCDAYLTKPCLPEKLIATVRDHFRREAACGGGRRLHAPAPAAATTPPTAATSTVDPGVARDRQAVARRRWGQDLEIGPRAWRHVAGDPVDGCGGDGSGNVEAFHFQA